MVAMSGSYNNNNNNNNAVLLCDIKRIIITSQNAFVRSIPAITLVSYNNVQQQNNNNNNIIGKCYKTG